MTNAEALLDNAFAKANSTQAFKSNAKAFAINARAFFPNIIAFASFAEAFFDIARSLAWQLTIRWPNWSKHSFSLNSEMR
jgi:hypothetical protein